MALEDRSGRINHSAPVHIYRQVAADIRKDISSGVLAPGARLPAEPELARDVYGVARITIRKAIKELVSEGLLVIVRGRGTFVRPDDDDNPPGTSG